MLDLRGQPGRQDPRVLKVLLGRLVPKEILDRKVQRALKVRAEKREPKGRSAHLVPLGPWVLPDLRETLEYPDCGWLRARILFRATMMRFWFRWFAPPELLKDQNAAPVEKRAAFVLGGDIWIWASQFLILIIIGQESFGGCKRSQRS